MSPKTFGRIAGLACFLVLQAGSMAAQMVAVRAQGPAPETVEVSRLAALHGIAFCRENGAGFFFVRGDLTDDEAADVTAHERTHLAQHRRFPSCAAFNAWYKTPRGMLESESEAYARGWCVSVARGADANALRSAYVQILYMSYLGGGTPVFEIAQTFERYARCP